MTEVLIALAVIWAGIAFLLFRIDRKLTALEKRINE